MMKVATTFSGGFGSVEIALKYLNIPHEVVFACEWMDPQRKSYLLNHAEPTSNFYKDIRDLDGNKYHDEIDWLHESPPCQSYSMAGSRGGASDERGGLMFEAIKKIDEIQPKMFSVENVRGLLSSNNGEDWKNILKDFNSLKGYTISWGIMNAKEQDTPQNRERVFIVGFRGKAPQMSFPKRVPLTRVLRDVLEDEVDEKYFLSQKMIDGFTKHKERHEERGNGFKFQPRDINGIASSISTKAGNRQTDNYIVDKIGYINQDTQTSQVISPDGVSSSLCAGTHGYAQGYIADELVQVGNIDQLGHNSLWGRVYDVDGIAPTQNAKGGGAGAKTGLFLIPSGHKKGHVEVGYGDSINLAFVKNPNSRGTARTDGILNTLDTSCNQAVVLDRIRRLTPRECARVQGDFQDMFKFGEASDTKLYEFIGNAMDISTTKNLILKMLEHCEIVKFTEPLEPRFEMNTKEKPIDTLF